MMAQSVKLAGTVYTVAEELDNVDGRSPQEVGHATRGDRTYKREGGGSIRVRIVMYPTRQVGLELEASPEVPAAEIAHLMAALRASIVRSFPGARLERSSIQAIDPPEGAN